MRLEGAIWGLTLLLLVVMTGIFILQDAKTNYSITFNDSTEDVFNQSQEVYNLAVGQKDLVLGEDIDEDDPLSSGIAGAKKAFDLTIAVPSLFGQMLNIIAGESNIDRFYIKIFNTLLLVSLIFAIAYLFFRIRAF